MQFKSLTEDQALRLRPCLQAALGEDALPSCHTSGKECRSIISNMLLSAISGSAISGRLVKIYNELLVAENIEKQVYWNGLVGPHLWRLFQRYAAIFATLRGKDIELSFSPESLNSII